jgi:GTP diphosphokinase / guanosine-3',5'-bis(diphosphate) 3'-diphosphatase
MLKTLQEIMPTAEMLAYEEASKKYHALYQLAKPTMRQGDAPKLKRAFHFALAADQKKKYWSAGVNISQALDIARIIAEDMGLGIVSIICALLYDLSEALAPSETQKIFGAQVAQTVHRLIELEAIPQFREISSTKSSEVLIVALTQEPRVALMKVAENLQKMRTLTHLPYGQQASIAAQTKYIYIPMAHRLGLNTIKAELEDLYLKFTNAIVYHTLTEQLKNTRNARERLIKRFTKPIQEALRRQDFPSSIKTRIKSLTSIRHKMQALGLPFEQVYDVFAIRIVLNVPESREKLSCWKAYEVVTNLYKVHPNKFRNWLSYPRSNGYQSLHATVMSHEGMWVEVQIRTKRMDEIAEKGHAAHWKYKETNKIEHMPGLDTWLNQIRTILEQESQNSDKLLDTIDASPEIRKIEVFTHQGQSVSLPVGATVLDFAFELGTAFGLGCIGAQINNEPVAYHYALNHNDQIKVMITGKQQIQEDWLDFTITYKARSAIKKFLQQEKKRKMARGKKLVREQLHQLHLEWNEEIIKQLLILLDEEKIEDLYFKLGEGSMALQHLKNFSAWPYKRRAHGLPHPNLRPFMQGFGRARATVAYDRW